VRLLETVSQSVPHGLWLLEVKQTGATVRLDGRAMSLTPVTDFAKVMQESGFFQMPVEIDSTNSEVFEEVPVIRFVMKADILNSGASPVKTTPVATTPAPAPATPAPTAAAGSPLNAEALPVPPASGPASTVAPPKTDVASVRPGGGR
jgi:hypothetical protein